MSDREVKQCVGTVLRLQKNPSGDEELSVATKRSEVRLKQTPTVWWVFVCHVILLFDFLVLNLRLTPLAVLLEVNLALDELAILT